MKITVGIPEASRGEAAALYWEAFGAKLGFTMGPKYRALIYINRVMRSDHGICAHDAQGRLIGVAGFKTAQGALVGGTFTDIRKVYGWVGAAIRVSLMGALERDTENERFLMDGIFVTAAAQGQGVGTALLDAVCAEAANRGFAEVRLDVINTNPRARALYERRGFVAGEVQQLGPLKHIFNFESATMMIRQV